MDNIDTIIFDLGGVLIDWNPRRLYEKIFHSTEAVDYFLTHVTNHDWNELQDAGRPITEANKELISRFPQYKPEIEAYYGRWEEEMLGGPISGTVEILDHFVNQSNLRVLALTNWSTETFPAAQAKFQFLQWFEGILVSGNEKLKKPDPVIFHLLATRYKLKPEKSLFIDDSLRNIEAATSLGYQVIHFQSPSQLRIDLKNISLW